VDVTEQDEAAGASGLDRDDPLAYGEFNCLTASDEALYWKLVIADHPSTPDLPEIPDAEALWEAIDRPLFLETFKVGACQCCSTVTHLICGPSRFGEETWACDECWNPAEEPLNARVA
jgi:hypothetical protein